MIVVFNEFYDKNHFRLEGKMTRNFFLTLDKIIVTFNEFYDNSLQTRRENDDKKTFSKFRKLETN